MGLPISVQSLFAIMVFQVTSGIVEDGEEVETILTAYYPDTFSDDESGMVDVQGNRLRTLQDYLDGRAPYVTVSMDPRLKVPYGTRVIIPTLNDHFGVKNGIRFEARDAGPHMEGAGFSRLDVCVRSEQDSYDVAVNRVANVVFLFPNITRR
ncbi:hypothetical protein GE061_014514 [Apolygus lucorum]|uniref:3D domain-containing protein n=1 Tax=Apolygus lucorum TaxID=248454 RepID=A0A6A4J8X3_APOLU|nr:hypothetical protein GE061_014514 [Apolygus lucorum]